MPTFSEVAVANALKLGTWALVLLGAVVLFFVVKWGMRTYKTYKNYKIKAVIHNRDGTWYTDKIGKFKGKDQIDKMLFRVTGESMPVIDPAYIIANCVELWRYAPGQYAVIPPKQWSRDPKDFKIEVIDFQMKNFAYLEQRAAVSRWAYIKDLLQKWAPWITAVLIMILAGVGIYILAKFGNTAYADAAAVRVKECTDILGMKGSVPTA